jgi:hypothetical protein
MPAAGTIRGLLVPLLTHPRVSQAIKYFVYGALMINFGFYVSDDWMAFNSALGPDATFAEIVQIFSTSIDTAAWVGLVILLELETYVLPDEAFKGWVSWTMKTATVICYCGVVYAAYGYTQSTVDLYDNAQVPDLTNHFQIADQGTAIQKDVIAYEDITKENCDVLSQESKFYRVGEDIAIIDGPTLDHSQNMGNVDIVNAVVWLIVVILIEMEVWFQSADRFSSPVLGITRRLKSFMYCILIGNGVIWVYTGYPLYAWDAFLWIAGFWAIELNLVEWEQERLEELA